MMVYFRDKNGEFRTDGDVAELMQDAVEHLIKAILGKGLGLNDVTTAKLNVHGGLIIMSMPWLKTQAGHRDVTFDFNAYDEVCLAVNLPIFKKRSVILWPCSHHDEDGGVTTSTRPIEIVTYPGTMFVWNPKVYHAGGANNTGTCSVTMHSISNSCLINLFYCVVVLAFTT